MATLSETIQKYTSRYRTAVLGRGVVWVFLIAAGSFVLWWGLRQWFPDPRISDVIPCVLSGVGVGFTYWWIARHWITHKQSAASLDKSLGLQNRLVTLEEFAKTDPRPELYAQLEADAQRALDPDRVPVPQALDRTSLILALILLLLMVLPVRGISPLQQLASLSKQMQSKQEPPTPSPSQSAQDQNQQQSQDQQDSSGGGAQQQAQGDSQQDQSSEGEQSKGDQSKQNQAKADQQSGEQQDSQDRDQSKSKGDQGKQQQAKGGDSSRDQQPSGKQQGGQKSQQSGDQQGDGQQQHAKGSQGQQKDGQSGQQKQDASGSQSQQAGAQAQTGQQQQQQQQAQGGQGQGMSQPTAQQEALRAEIQQLLKEVSGELKDLQRQLAQVQAEPIPSPGTDTDPNLYEDATQLDPLTGTPVPIAVKPDAGETSKQRKAEGVGGAGDEVAPDAPTTQDEDAALSDTPVEERATNRQVVPPEYRDVFDRLNRPAEEPQTEDAK